MDATMGNQQLSSPLDRGWLAGIIDGEGCLQLARQPYRGKHHYRPFLSIGNTNPKIIENIVKIAKDNSLPIYVMTREVPAPRSKRKSWVIQITGLKRVKQWLEYVGNDLKGKKEQAEVLRKFIEYRLSIPITTIPGVHCVSQKDEEFKTQMTQLNQQYKGELLND